MIEITWYPEGATSNLGYSKSENNQHAYACGWLKPNYQVPATIEPATITLECIAVFHVRDHSCDCSIAAIWYKN